MIIQKSNVLKENVSFSLDKVIPRLRPSDDTYTERAFGVSANLVSAHGACVCIFGVQKGKCNIWQRKHRAVVFNNNQCMVKQ